MSDITRRSVVHSVSERSDVVRGDRTGRGADQGWKSGLGVAGAPRTLLLLLMVSDGRGEGDGLPMSPREDQLFEMG